MHTNRNRLCTLSFIVAFCAGLFLPLTEAVAQSEQELRREVEQLRERNRELERELQAARQQIQTLEQAVERLSDRLRALRDDRPDEDDEFEEEVTVDESDPHASPRAMFRAMQESYRETLGDMDIGEAAGRQRSIYLRSVERWRARINRDMRGSVAWHVRVLESEESRAGYRLKVQAIDPKTAAALGEPFELELPRRVARRYEQLVERRQAETLALQGVLIPDVQVNSERHEAGAFNVPPLIGPFAEFNFRIEVSAVMRPGEDQDRDRR